MERKRNSRLGYWGWLAVIILVVVLALGLLYVYRAIVPPI
jgi:predicted nucleic acid-binding Zn ribbon protein